VYERIRFVGHQGKQILLVDLSQCPAATVGEVVRKLPDVVSTQPLRSVLILADFTGEDIPPEFRQDMSRYSLREFPSFKSREEALEWLVKD
jgi:hypothetical protein